MAAKSGIFISYARSDGQGFADNLRARLARGAPEIPVWQDRPEIEGGLGWWRQIEDALERVEFLVVVMTPAVLRSAVTRLEWRAARQSGVAVFPIKGPGLDPASAEVPRWMSKLHWYDLDVQWEQFVAHLRRGATPVRVPFMAPPLPNDFINRAQELGTLKRLLLTQDKHDAIAITTALTGAGGFGKTTLAAAMAHDDDVLTAFDDGILWATLGQSPNLQGELTRLYAALTGERPAFVSVEDAAQALGDKLQNRNCLIVIDDVWNPADLGPFCRGGSGCARLVTTRQAAVAAEAERVEVDEMTAGEAVALLIARLPQKPASLDPFRQLAHRLGEWPLLLKLAAGALRQRIERGDTLAGALAYVGKALDRRGVVAFDRENAGDRRGAVASTIDLGLEQLAADDRDRCIRLAIFPEDEDVPIDVAGELWGLDAFDTEETLSRLDNSSLVDFDLKLGLVQVHDVVLAYFATRLPGAGQSAHETLLATWGDKHRLPHAFAWRWVVRHLLGAGRQEDVDALLGDVSWLEAKLDRCGIYALLEDFRHVSPGTDAALLAAALQVASHALAHDPSQLVAQLLARLPTTALSLRASLQQQAAGRKPWLRPLLPSLSGPGGPLVRTLDMPGAVSSLVVSDRGNRIFATTDDGKLAVWDIAEGTKLQVFSPSTAAATDDPAAAPPVGAAAFLAAMPGECLALGGSRGLAVWDPRSGSAPCIKLKIPGGVIALAVAADASRLLVGSRKGTLHAWQTDSWEPLPSLRGHRSAIASVAITADGRTGLSGGYDKAARLWNLDTGDLIETLYASNEGVIYCVALSFDGRLALTGAADANVRLWELNPDRGGAAIRFTLSGHTHRVYAVAFSPDGRFALSGSHDRTVRVWDLESGKPHRILQGHADSVNALALPPGGRSAFSGGQDRTVRLWSLDAGEVRAPTQEHEGWIHAVAMAPDGSVAVTSGQDGVLRVWNPGKGEVVHELAGHRDVVSAIALDWRRKLLVSGSRDGKIHVRELQTERPQVLSGASGAISALAIAPATGKTFVGTQDGFAQVWDIDRARIERRWEAHRRAVTFAAVSAHGQVAITGSSDGTLSIWDPGRPKCFRSLPAHNEGVTSGTLSQDSRLLLTGGGDGTLRIWSFPGCRMLASLAAHAGRVRSIQLLEPAGLVVTSGYDRHVKVWHYPSLAPVAAFECDSVVTGAAASADGRLIVAGDALGCAHFLRLEADDGSSSGPTSTGPSPGQ